LPPTERAAVVLRYGYDLPYAQIGDALGSSEEAARAAASSGVRRLRRGLSAPTSGGAGFARASVCDADQERSL
jgi:DNA-directed RNA polymerase specialized sigma24 family protein